MLLVSLVLGCYCCMASRIEFHRKLSSCFFDEAWPCALMGDLFTWRSEKDCAG